MAANGSEKAFCVLKFHDCRSVTIVQRQFRIKFGKPPPFDNSIRRWYAQFQETGCVCKTKSTGRPSVTEEQVEQVRQAFLQRPRKSIVRGSREMGITQPTVWRISRKRLKLKPYRLMLLQKLQPDNHHRRTTFCTELQALMEEDGFFNDWFLVMNAHFRCVGKLIMFAYGEQKILNLRISIHEESSIVQYIYIYIYIYIYTHTHYIFQNRENYNLL